MEEKGNSMSVLRSSVLSDENLKFSFKINELGNKEKEFLSKIDKNSDLKKVNFQSSNGNFRSDLITSQKKEKELENIPFNFKQELDEIINDFYMNHRNDMKIEEFKDLYRNSQVSKLELFCKINTQFSNFQIFSHFDVTETKETKTLQRKILRRNNFFLMFLIKYNENEVKLEKIDNLVSDFCKLNFYAQSNIIEGCDLEVDFFFLNYFGFKQYASRMLLANIDSISMLKKHQFERDSIIHMIRDFNWLRMKEGSSVTDYISSKQNGSNLGHLEGVLIQEVVYGCVRRKLFEGLLLLIEIECIFEFFLNREFWEVVIKCFEPKLIFQLWKLYLAKIGEKSSQNKKDQVKVHKNEKDSLKSNINNSNEKLLDEDNPKTMKNSKIEEQVNCFNHLLVIIDKLYNKRNSISPSNNLENKRLIDILFYFLERRQGSIIAIDEFSFEISLTLNEAFANETMHIITIVTAKRSYMEKALKSQFFKVAFYLSKFSICREVLNHRDYQTILVENIHRGNKIYYSICLLNMIEDHKIYIDLFSKIFKSFNHLLKTEKEVMKIRHPILTFVVSAEFLLKWGNANPRFSYKCEEISQNLLELGQSIQYSVKDGDALSFYLIHQFDQKGRNSLQIMAENRFFSLLKHDKVDGIVSHLWYGKNKIVNFFKYCSMSRILFSNIYYERFDECKSYNQCHYDQKTYYFQYYYYIKNCHLRYIFDVVFVIITTFVYQIILYLDYSIPLYQEVSPRTDNAFNILNWVGAGFILTGNIQYIFYFVFLYKSGRKMRMEFFIALDIFVTILVILNQTTLTQILEGFSEDTVDSMILSGIIFCRYMKVFTVFNETQIYGPFIRSVFLIMNYMLNFLVIFFCVLLLFSQIFTLLFSQYNQDFINFTTSFINLFSASFGLFNISNFNVDVYALAYTIEIIFVTLTNLLMLNLIVSIIQKMYDGLLSVGEYESRAVLINAYDRMKWDDSYGLLIILPAPFNILSLFFIIYLLFAEEKNKVRLNTTFSKICYSILVLIHFLFLLIISLIFYPITLVKSYIHYFFDMLIHTTLDIRLMKNMSVTFFTLPFELFYQILNDIYLIFMLAYTYPPDLDNDFNHRKKEIYPKEAIHLVRKLFEMKGATMKKRSFHISEFFESMRRNTNQAHFTIMTKSFYDKNYEFNSNVNLSDENDDENFKTINKFIFQLLTKLKDQNNLIDVDVGLSHLPFRFDYNDIFIEELNSLEIGDIERGFKNYRFKIEKRINYLSYYDIIRKICHKIFLKMKFILGVMPEESLNDLYEEYRKVNNFHTNERNKLSFIM